MNRLISENELYHYGVKGMRWGVRRYQKYGEGGYNPKKKGKFINSVKKKSQKLKDIKLTDNQKKALIAAAAVGITVAGFAAYKRFGQDYISKTIKAGTTIQNLNMDPKRLEKGEAFFASYKMGDNLAYKGLFGNKNSLKGGEVKFLNTAVAAKDMKIASNKEGQRVFKKMMKTNPEFNKAVTDSFRDENFNTVFKASKNPMQKAREQLSKKQYDKAYTMFNRGTLVATKDDASVAAQKMYYAELKKRGFSGINDINDMRYSGFRTNSPAIIFDRESLAKNQKGGVTIASRKLNPAEIETNKAGQFVRIGAGTAAGSAAITYVGTENYLNDKKKKNKKS